MEKNEQMQQILDIAAKNNNHISYVVALDLLKENYGDEAEDKELLGELFLELSEYGITVERGEDTEDYGDDTAVDAGRYIPADVKITPRNLTIDIIQDRLEHKEIDMNPDFQRKAGLWSVVQQSRLIESLMLKIPIPTFYFDASNEDKWIVIDGLQRLTSLYNFMVAKTLKLQGLEYLTEFEGYTIEELPRQYYRRIRETQIQIYTIEKGTPEEIVYNIFKRINTGGLTLTSQEIRHALYQGKATRLLEELADSDAFLNVTKNSIKKERMQDCEYINRYLAYTELDYKKQYNGNVDSFLIEALKLVNTYGKDEIAEIKQKFESVMQDCSDILGKYAFRKISPEGRRGPINKALFEMWVYCIFECTDEEVKRLVRKKDVVLQKYQILLQRSEIASAIKAGDKYSVTNRIHALKKMIEEILND